MIISASRRTDIPAFYSDWFFKRLEEGYLYVRNPMNPGQVSKILLNQDTVDCFVFWTKDPGPMMERLSVLDRLGYPYYFQFTLTPYGADVEPGLPHKNELVKTFRELSASVSYGGMIRCFSVRPIPWSTISSGFHGCAAAWRDIPIPASSVSWICTGR
jgi:hypothetical protein